MKTILILDDDSSIVEIITEFLYDQFKNRVELYGTTDPEIALGITDSCFIDIAILDMKMPCIDGFSLLKLMNGQVKTAIFITGHPDWLTEIPHESIYQTLEKPVPPVILGDTVKKAMLMSDEIDIEIQRMLDEIITQLQHTRAYCAG